MSTGTFDANMSSTAVSSTAQSRVSIDGSRNDSGDSNGAVGVEQDQTTREVAALARQLTNTSLHTQHQHPDSPNPFLTLTPTFDPNSPRFDAKAWAEAILHAFAKDPERYPRQPIGVSWHDLSVHGFGADTDYQKDVLNVLWRVPKLVVERLSNIRHKIQILRDFDGLVRPGEMLMVLGKPGRCVAKTNSAVVHTIR